jgi:hypothetical protein|tara:strand:+ start:15378 stop:16025 length:648 start_codon:yes stop_codon:yes gene_type:complete
MGRELSAALQAAAATAHIRVLTFAKIELDSGTQYLHTGVGRYTWDDPDDGTQNWDGVGEFGGIGVIEEGEDLSPYGMTLMLSGLDASLMDEIQNQQYYLRSVTLYLGALNVDTGGLLADPDEIWAGFMDTGTISLGENNGIVVQCENEFATFDQANNRTFSDADLQNEYSGDLFFNHLASMVDAVVIWGGKETATGDNRPDRDDGDVREMRNTYR